MLRAYYIFLIIVGLCSSVQPLRRFFYRRDYTYIEEYDAFYKMHWYEHGHSWNSAFKVCDDEGAKLFYPKMKDEFKLAKTLSQNLVKQGSITEIFIGLEDDLKLGELNQTEGHSTEFSLGLGKSIAYPNRCVMMDIESGLFNTADCLKLFEDPASFICKKVEDCPTIDREYKYVRLLNKCYKVHNKKMDWNDAMQTCYVEGGHLAVLETDSEIKAVMPFLDVSTTYFVGFRKMFNNKEIYTIKGKIFENSLFRAWYKPLNNELKDCGVFRYDLKYTTITYMMVANCYDSYNFVCEII